jgi:predicted nucleic acid-binding protein
VTGAFLDSNILIYAFGADHRSERARDLMHAGSDIAVQSLNEFANVFRRKLKRPWIEILADLARLKLLFPEPVPLTTAVHEHGIATAERYGLSIWDGMIVAAALQTGCSVLWSEDMHDGLVVDGQLQVLNPFRAVN